MDMVEAGDLFSDEEDRPVRREGGYDDDEEDDGLGIPEAVEDNRGTQGQAAGAGAAKEGGAEEKPKKVVVRKPQPKLDPARVCGPRGIGILERTFQDFKPRGKGREFDDLDLVLGRMEHWAHRLYPKLPFDDVTDRIAVLGKKMAVRTYLKKMRVEAVDAANGDGQDGKQEDADTAARYADGDGAPAGEEDAFERLLREAQEEQQGGEAADDEDEEDLLREAARSQPAAAPMPTASQQQSPALSEEARERMARNRRLAEERRRERAARAAEERMASQQQGPASQEDQAEPSKEEKEASGEPPKVVGEEEEVPAAADEPMELEPEKEKPRPQDSDE